MIFQSLPCSSSRLFRFNAFWMVEFRILATLIGLAGTWSFFGSPSNFSRSTISDILFIRFRVSWIGKIVGDLISELLWNLALGVGENGFLGISKSVFLGVKKGFGSSELLLSAGISRMTGFSDLGFHRLSCSWSFFFRIDENGFEVSGEKRAVFTNDVTKLLAFRPADVSHRRVQELSLLIFLLPQNPYR